MLDRGHLSFFGLILGSYDGRKVNTSDLALFYDSIILTYLVASVLSHTPIGIDEVAKIGSNRILYFLGGNKTLLHEINHAKHHKILKKIGLDFQYMKDDGVEELVNRLERSIDSKSFFDRFMLFDYLVWTPWTGIRNLLIDTYHKIEKIPYAKNTLILNAIGDPWVFELYRWSQKFQPEKININLGVLKTNIKPEIVFLTTYIYWLMAVASAVVSAKRRETFGLKRIESVNTYKFPYTYNPIGALRNAFKIGKLIKVYKETTSPYMPIYDSKTLLEKLDHKFKIYPNRNEREIRNLLLDEADSLNQDVIEILSYPRESGIPLSYSKLRYL